jgi:aerobic carbon-monoxide dehydrogenase small subunit
VLVDVTLTVNGEPRTVSVAGWESLLWVLRERLGLPGAKAACEQGECGSCSVVLDGELVCSCLVMAADVEGSVVRTAEGFGDAQRRSRVQQAMLDEGAVQCGFCTPGLVVAIEHLLAQEPPPASEEDVREALAGNLCRCTGYGAILRAVAAAQRAPADGPVGGSPGGSTGEGGT